MPKLRNARSPFWLHSTGHWRPRCLLSWQVRFFFASLLALASVQPCAAEGPARLWLGGDVFLGTQGDDLLQPLAAIVSERAGVVNLEGPISLRPNRLPRALGKVRLLHPAQAAATLAAAGVRVAGIANNHSLDDGGKGPAHTAKVLSRNAIVPAGGGAGAALLTLAGLRVAVTAHVVGKRLPRRFVRDLLAARARADVLVVTLHTQGNASYLPRPELRAAVDRAVRAGASVIAVHGSHALALVERRGPIVIAWGLGNLAFACDCTDESDAMVLLVDLSADGVARAEVVPIRAGLRGAASMPAPDAGGILDLLESLGSRWLGRGTDRAWL